MMFKFIKAAAFFQEYAPNVMNWKHKLRGKNGRGNEIEFSPKDWQAIEIGWKKMEKEVSGSIFHNYYRTKNKK